ncbi:MAG: M55 family metallopeptidase [Anaerolineae bacterium]|nr:M55 family metallopeptidase [Anaerolineae bacterium]
MTKSIFISADMEGISGIVDNEYTTPGKSDYPRARQLMTDDVNAAVEGALDGGADNILVNDSHGPMRNILIEGLHTDARLLSGGPKPLSMMEGILSAAPLSPTTPLNYAGLTAPIGPRWDAAFFVGYHGRAGTPNAIIDHTWTGVILEVFLNGREVGEIGLNAALAGYLGIPVALVTGDDRACAEAVELLGENLQTAVVKRAVGRYAAECLGLVEARRVIREAAHRAVAGPYPAPLTFTPPYHLVVGWGKSVYAEAAATTPGSRRVDGRHVEITLHNMVDIYLAWRTFNNLAGTVS